MPFAKRSFSIMLTLFLILTLWFGGARETSILLNLTVLFFVTAVLLCWYRNELIRPLSKFPGYLLSIFCYFLLIIYIALQPDLLSAGGESHPSHDFTLFLSIDFPLLLGLYSILSAWHLAVISDGPKWLNKQIVRIGAIVAIIALSHWLVDNGKLFFMFEPEHIAKTTRARWPFVNPNHLAAFLLIPLCLATAHLENTLRAVSIKLDDERAQRGFQYSHYLGTDAGQRMILGLVVAFTPLLLMAIALIASQSRNGYLCLALLFLFASLRSLRTTPSTSHQDYCHDKDREIIDLHDLKLEELASKSSEPKHSHGRKLALPLLLLTLTLSVFLLSPRGAELIRERASYGLENTRDDIRFQLYKESLPLLTKSPLLGIGGGSWSLRYPTVQTSALNGYRPRYLHSDPYQYVIEYGFIALLPLIFIAVLLVLTIRKSAHTERSQRLLTERAYLTAGVTLMLIFSCFDFPFHIGATASLFAISLTSLFFYGNDLS